MILILVLTKEEIEKIPETFIVENYGDITLANSNEEIIDSEYVCKLDNSEKNMLSWLRTQKDIWLFVSDNQYINLPINDRTINNLLLN